MIRHLDRYDLGRYDLGRYDRGAPRLTAVFIDVNLIAKATYRYHMPLPDAAPFGQSSWTIFHSRAASCWQGVDQGFFRRSATTSILERGSRAEGTQPARCALAGS